MLEKEIVERDKSSKWVFPFFIVRVKNHSSRRKAKNRSGVDFRRLNPWLKVVDYPFPVDEEMIDEIPYGTTFVFTHLDMANSCNQELVVETRRMSDHRSSYKLTLQ